MRPWIGVDLDGTLARYEGWQGHTHIGEPILPVVARVKAWLDQGLQVKVFTARVSVEDERERTEARGAIERWCWEHIGQKLPVTHEKDYGMLCLYDDRCCQVEANTGRLLGEEFVPWVAKKEAL